MSNINNNKDIYLLSKQVNKKILNIIKIKKTKDENEGKQIFFEESEKVKNKKYNKENISILKYYIENKKNIKIFGNKFVKENNKKCRIIVNNKGKEIKNYIKIKKKKNLRIKLEIYGYLINLKEMFKECEAFREINKLNTYFVTNMSYIFSGCRTLPSLPDISKWSTNNVNDMNNMFLDVEYYLVYLIFQNGVQIM